jgi:hypothetical protein
VVVLQQHNLGLSQNPSLSHNQSLVHLEGNLSLNLNQSLSRQRSKQLILLDLKTPRRVKRWSIL